MNSHPLPLWFFPNPKNISNQFWREKKYDSPCQFNSSHQKSPPFRRGPQKESWTGFLVLISILHCMGIVLRKKDRYFFHLKLTRKKETDRERRSNKGVNCERLFYKVHHMITTQNLKIVNFTFNWCTSKHLHMRLLHLQRSVVTFCVIQIGGNLHFWAEEDEKKRKVMMQIRCDPRAHRASRSEACAAEARWKMSNSLREDTPRRFSCTSSGNVQ